jgi:hypothetical protein
MKCVFVIGTFPNKNVISWNILLQTFINIYMKQTIQYFQLFCYIAGLDALTNKIPGYYYGISKQWKMEENVYVYKSL